MRLPTQLLRRKVNTHKGDFGHIFILAGSLKFSGAAALASEAAMRSGAGSVTLGIPESLTRAMIKIKAREVMILPLPKTKEGTLSIAAYKKIKDFSTKADVLVVGPGLTQDKSTQGLVRKVITQVNKPMVIDADGLNALAGYLNILLATSDQRPATILTPHPGEMARLLGISVKKIERNRKKIAQGFAKKYKVTVVLKGHDTIVADYGGNLYLNKTGNPGMATAGSGDVLTGMIAAFLGQGLNAFNAAKYAVYLHGLAGDLAAKEKTQISMLASDIIDKIPQAIRKCS
ncbi:MAG: NAD(P)H-hydrate dehydratase [Candidatus Omnitrophica bacterium]|nr:NAD(P)H-hydrate dehydratase [Candidatus Omnitrophota bacterium]MDD5592613.1 NAD(P)H-hydrate dehydratase [Candidatus Omnitrophota bacterium]